MLFTVLNNVRSAVVQWAPRPKTGPSLVSREWDIFETAVQGKKEATLHILAWQPELLNQPNAQGNRLLDVAIANGHHDLTMALIDKGADINAKDVVGVTALHLAILNSPDEVVEMLIANGADIYARTPHGATPMQLARMYGRTNVIEMIQKAKEDYRWNIGS